MHFINNLLFFVLLYLTSPLIFASVANKFNDPYVGIESIFTNQNYKQGYGKDLYPKNSTDYNIFAGVKFNKYFGAELGYEFQPKRKNVVVLGPGKYLPGNALVANGESVTLESSIKAAYPYLGLFGEQQITSINLGTFKFQLMIGLSVASIEARHALLATQGGNLAPNTYNEFVRTFSNTSFVPMAKLSMSHSISSNLNIRVSLNYRHLSNFKLKVQQRSVAQIRLQNTLGVGIGLVALF